MARYSDDMPSWFIDAKELWKLLIQQREKNKELSCGFSMNAGINQAVCYLNSLPAADVEVVRCKACRFLGWRGTNTNDCGYFYCRHPSGLRVIKDAHTSFCYFGERKMKE